MSGIAPHNAPQAKIIPSVSYTLGDGDFAQVMVFTNNSPIAVTLPSPGTVGGTMYGNWDTVIFALGDGSVTITPQPPLQGRTPTINGGASQTIPSGNSSFLVLGTDGNWYATTSAAAAPPPTVLAAQVITNAGNVTVAAAATYVAMRQSVPAAVQITLPANPVLGRFVTIKDSLGVCNTTPFTIATSDGSLIDGAATYFMGVRFQAFSFVFDGVGWGVTG